MRATSSAIPRPSAPGRRAPALPHWLRRSPIQERRPGERALVGGAGAGPPLSLRPGPPLGGGVAAAVAGPKAASLAPLRAGRCGVGAPDGRGAAGPWSWERGAGAGGGTADR